MRGNLLQLCLTFTILWTVAHQPPLFMEFSRQEYWNGLPFSSPGDLPDCRIKPVSPVTTAPPGKHIYIIDRTICKCKYICVHSQICIGLKLWSLEF